MISVVTPKWMRRLFPSLTWDIKTTEKKVFLTFDDGPEPSVTQEVLGLLRLYNAKATFFCLGEKAHQYPEFVSLIREDGHTIGNHGYAHISGFSTGKKQYVQNCILGASETQSTLFRPPYGRITPWQIKALPSQYKIIQWSIMSMDFSYECTPEICASNVISNIYPGAIVVFHDSRKAYPNLKDALPVVLEKLHNEGYIFEKLL